MQATWQLQWPATNPKRLAPRFVPLGEAEAAIAKGSGNPEFRIARVEEDGEEAAAPAAAAAGGAGEGRGARERRGSGAGASGDALEAIDKRLVERRRRVGLFWACLMLS